jgi:hypothetical protein
MPKEYLRSVIIGADQFINTLAAGPADETISGRLGHEDILPVIGPALRFALNKIDPGHTASSNEYDALGLPSPHHLPPLAQEAFDEVMAAGDEYLHLDEVKLAMAEEWARLMRLRESGMTECTECGRLL